MIRPATADDAGRICAIYNHYVRETVVTFEEAEVTEVDMAGRIRDAFPRFSWLVIEDAGDIVGYAYARQWRPRAAYRHSAESSIYVAPGATRRGLGPRLYTALLAELRQRDLHSVIGGVALPNDPSVALHERLGFTKVAHFRDVGFKLGRWVDVAYWQLAL